ncbi:MAG: PIN domain-containing protein [Gammaproteobacteria bacterium]|nr:MAG: PIN domain-containing protein [Gammaproteobacteria bacterium]
MRIVVDASVSAKWFLQDDEDHLAESIRLLRAIETGRTEAVQPPHWLAEVAAVLTRRFPQSAEVATDLLIGLGLDIAEDPEIYRRAVRLSWQLNHHLFDTLYHAVALEHGATLVTADRGYWRKAADQGHIALLESFSTD